MATASSASRADEFNTMLGAGVGAVAGAVIGQSVAGRNGAIIGAGAGGLVGASIAQRGSYPAPVAYTPPPAVVVPAPVYAVQQWRPEYRNDHGHHYGWDRDHRDYRGYAPPPPRQERPFIDGRGDQERLRHERWD
jgi:hypothetical protein